MWLVHMASTSAILSCSALFSLSCFLFLLFFFFPSIKVFLLILASLHLNKSQSLKIGCGGLLIQPHSTDLSLLLTPGFKNLSP